MAVAVGAIVAPVAAVVAVPAIVAVLLAFVLAVACDPIVAIVAIVARLVAGTGKVCLVKGFWMRICWTCALDWSVDWKNSIGTAIFTYRCCCCCCCCCCCG